MEAAEPVYEQPAGPVAVSEVEDEPVAIGYMQAEQAEPSMLPANIEVETRQRLNE